jgi:hypothetical protein
MGSDTAARRASHELWSTVERLSLAGRVNAVKARYRMGTHKSCHPTSRAPSTSFSRNSKPHGTNDDDDGEHVVAGAAGSTSIGSLSRGP